MFAFDLQRQLNRRLFLRNSSVGIGVAALATLLERDARGAGQLTHHGLAELPHFPAKARRVIWLTQAGAPSQLELFDYKPHLKEQFNEDLPASVRGSQRLTGMTSGQSRFPVAPSIFRFAQHGDSGIWLSELLPHTARIADRICLVRSLYTEAINHDPAMTLLQTGHQIAGRPSLGAWLSYGLGSENDNLPAYVVMISRPSGQTNAQPLHERMWGSGFLPPRYQGVRFSPGKDPVLFLSNPPGITSDRRRRMLDDVAALDRLKLEDYHDPETQSRIDQYELAFRMQTAVPELADLSREPASVFARYGPESRKPGTYAANCILARRLAERGVRFIQLYHRGWDQHNKLPHDIKSQCYDTDQATAALIEDLEHRGMLDDTLVVWGGEFGRTVYSQGTLTSTTYGRDHHPRCFSIWMAGAGIKPGHVHGETDDYCYNIVRDPVHIHDLNATVLSLLGIEHTRFTYRYLGRDYRLTDVSGQVVKGVLA
ncbi:MAG TPA: DUF1501 domain-containing protein [Planctomycetaceae bacterium]|jgi:hypothetical protein|nr:DUF1501 domain-containing protein [Planctomycetaceae bacterium]